MTRVLVVEDNPNNRKLMVLVLQKHGYETIEAVTGEKGVEKAAQTHPDLILMDIMLPGIDGLEATERIRRIGGMQDVPIIAITSYAMAGDRERILAAGCNGHIEKPINPLTIMKDIEKIIKVAKS